MARKRLEDYYSPDSTMQIVDRLSDPNLRHHRDREQVNQLVMNLVIKFIADYLRINKTDPRAISRGAESVWEGRKHEKIEDVVAALMSGMGQAMGDTEIRPDMFRSNSDMFALECILDVQATAALVKEIVFMSIHSDSREYFLGIDMGAGTGILTLAAMIMGRRNQFGDSTILGIENRRDAVVRAKETFRRIGISDRACRVEHVDAKTPGLMTVFNGLPLHLWLSETITSTSPLISVRNGRIEVADDSLFESTHGHMDPFPFIARQTTIDRPRFVADVQAGRTRMFPDVVNGGYTPGTPGAIKLSTSLETRRATPLHRIGEEFRDFEPLIRDVVAGGRKGRFPDPKFDFTPEMPYGC